MASVTILVLEAFSLQTVEEKMSDQTEATPAQPVENAETTGTEEKPAETTTTEVDATQTKTPVKKVKSKKGEKTWFGLLDNLF